METEISNTHRSSVPFPYSVPQYIEDAEEIFQKQLTEAEQKMYLGLTSAQMEDYKETFETFDMNGNGSIEGEEIEEALMGVGYSV